MKKFILNILIISSLLLFFIVGSVLMIPKDNNDYLCEYEIKLDKMKNTKSPRYIFLGGSNLAFGLDSKRIQDSLNVNVVNMGLHAGLGIRFPMTSIKPFVRKGDVIVLSIEYENFFNGQSEGGAENLSKLMISSDWSGFCNLDNIQKINVLKDLPAQSLLNIKRLHKYIVGVPFDTPAAKEKYNYLKSGFNKYGDEVSHWSLPSDVPKLVINRLNRDWKYDGDFENFFVDMIQSYKDSGAHVVMLPPVVAKSSYEGIEKYVDYLKLRLKRRGILYTSKPKSIVLQDNMFYNTNYHCNKIGVDKNTNNIISIFRKK